MRLFSKTLQKNDTLHVMALCLLLFNGAGAYYGSFNLIAHPDGSSLGMSLSLIEDTPFKNYLVPGIVLLLLNGLLDTFIFFATLLRAKHYQYMIAAQGAVLMTWLIIQLMFIQQLDKMHLIMGATALFLIIAGLLIAGKIKKNHV